MHAIPHIPPERIGALMADWAMAEGFSAARRGDCNVTLEAIIDAGASAVTNQLFGMAIARKYPELAAQIIDLTGGDIAKMFSTSAAQEHESMEEVADHFASFVVVALARLAQTA